MLLRYTSTFHVGRGKERSVVYWRALFPSAQERADELNKLDTKGELNAYNVACANAKATGVTVKVEEVDE